MGGATHYLEELLDLLDAWGVDNCILSMASQIFTNQGSLLGMLLAAATQLESPSTYFIVCCGSLTPSPLQNT